MVVSFFLFFPTLFFPFFSFFSFGLDIRVGS